jgi:hypothetical protein
MTLSNSTGITLDKIISDTAPDHDFIPKKLWVGKCAQMIYAANVSKSLLFFFELIEYIVK